MSPSHPLPTDGLPCPRPDCTALRAERDAAIKRWHQDAGMAWNAREWWKVRAEAAEGRVRDKDDALKKIGAIVARQLQEDIAPAVRELLYPIHVLCVDALAQA